jgi:hypothetical protein
MTPYQKLTKIRNATALPPSSEEMETPPSVVQHMHWLREETTVSVMDTLEEQFNEEFNHLLSICDCGTDLSVRMAAVKLKQTNITLATMKGSV